MVTGLGQCCLDYLGLIDSYPKVDSKKEVLEWHEQGGGPVATALVVLSRLGLKCKFFGIIGDDAAGERIRKSLKDEGIDVSGLIKREKASSQIAFIAIEKQTGRRTIFWRRPSGKPLKPDEIEDKFLVGSKFLILDGLMKEVSLYAAGRARELNIPIMLDAGKKRSGMLQIAKLSDYVVTSEEFARELGWTLSHKALKNIQKDLGIKALTITLGKRGSLTIADDQFIHAPAFQVDAIDTTGAGDVFHGGYIYGLLQKWKFKDILIFASAVAAMKCTKVGGRTGIPGITECMKFLKQRGYRYPS
jgi:sulfofructose kinase